MGFITLRGDPRSRVSGDDTIGPGGVDGTDRFSLVSDRGRMRRQDVWEYVSALDEEERDLLKEQSRIVLRAHGDIQKEHRGQANRLLRAYAGGVGLILAGVGFASTWIRDIPLPEIQNASIRNPTFQQYLFFLSVTVIGAFLVSRAFLRFAGIIEIVVQVLTPERIESESLVAKLFGRLPFYPGEATSGERYPFDAGAREGVRRVLGADDLVSIARHPELSEERILADRLMRAQDNENVINYNMSQLSQVYEIISNSLVDVLLGSLLMTIGLVPLSTL